MRFRGARYVEPWSLVCRGKYVPNDATTYHHRKAAYGAGPQGAFFQNLVASLPTCWPGPGRDTDAGLQLTWRYLWTAVSTRPHGVDAKADIQVVYTPCIESTDYARLRCCPSNAKWAAQDKNGSWSSGNCNNYS